ncbi:RHS repeat-associated core domain-containing protein [Pseudomonas sp. Leaf127]|uniref:RHS repeat-associated core domain-containing protein n=1 Tax=Pseudomonas sp. Leaf127 TaxID=1736267 RepID=UPI0009EC1D46|nr:RHS repeat-associated core domain-containing protein [Pseudomonas sp. Leaf127]
MKPAPSAWLCRYHYDPLDRLAGTVTNNQQDVMCFYKKSRLATEINGALQRTVVEAGDQALAQQRMLGKVTETDLLATDQQRSILRRVQPSGIESLGYAAYGSQPAQSGLDSVLGFTGERRDSVTGHYLLGNGYRAFNPVLMRFNSPDSLSPFGEGGLNAYVYCQGDPVSYLDPTGHVRLRVILGGRRLSNVATSPASVPSLAVTRPSVIQYAGRTSSRVEETVASGGGASSTASNSRGAIPAGSVPIESFTPEKINAGLGQDIKFYRGHELERVSDGQYKAHMMENTKAIMSFARRYNAGQIDSRFYLTTRIKYATYVLKRLEGRYKRFIGDVGLRTRRKHVNNDLAAFRGDLQALENSSVRR